MTRTRPSGGTHRPTLVGASPPSPAGRGLAGCQVYRAPHGGRIWAAATRLAQWVSDRWNGLSGFGRRRRGVAAPGVPSNANAGIRSGRFRRHAVRLAGWVGTAITPATAGPALAADFVYWTLGSAIYRSDLNGANQTVLYPAFGAVDVAVDPTTNRIYWSDNSTVPGRIVYANLNGGGTPTILLTTGLSEQIHHIEIDVANQMIYWDNFNTLHIWRSSITSPSPQLLPLNPASLRDIALDLRPTKLHLYYTDGTRVVRSNLDGTGAVALPNSIGPDVFGIAIDTCSDFIFSVGKTAPHPGVPAGFIRRADLSDAGNLITLIQAPAGFPGDVGLDPSKVVLDLNRGDMYWTAATDPTVRTAKLDGSSPQVIAQGTSAQSFRGIAIMLDNPGCPPPPSGGLLLDGCFPTGTVLHAYPRNPGNPWLPGEWNAENATITGPVSGVTPFEGSAMLRVNATGGSHSQVSQIIDVSAFATQIDAGRVTIEASVQVNAAEATTAPQMFVLAGDSQTVVGTLNPVRGTVIHGFNRAVTGFTVDADPASWETMRVSMVLPVGTRFLHFELLGANATIPATSLFFDCATVELQPLERLRDGCFPSDTVLHTYPRTPGNPWLPGEWNAEAATITGPDAGINPFEGDAMLRVNATGGAASQVSQIVDVSAFASQIDAGLVTVGSSVWVNAAVATTAPSMFILAGTSQTVVGTLNPVLGTVIEGFNRALTGFTVDNDPASWEPMSVSLLLPSGTRFLHFELLGANATIPPTGLFFDCATVELEVAPSSCYADCDQSTGPGVLDIFDFLCFGNMFATNDPYACGCDTSTGPGVCDIFDFLCFGNAFSAGCEPSACPSPPLMAVRIDTEVVMLFDGCDGTPLNPEFIVGGPLGMRRPIEALHVPTPSGAEIWVSDQLADAIFRFDQSGGHLGTITGGMDDIRGMEALGNVVYVSNAGTNNGAPGPAVVMFDTAGNHLGHFVAGTNPFDVLAYQGNLLVTDINVEDILMFTSQGVFAGIFHDSNGVNGIDFPGQMSVKPSNGNVLVAGFSPPLGIYEYDPAGTQVNYIATGGTGVRGVYELGNGDLLYSDDAGVHRWSNGQSTLLIPGVFRFITPMGP